MCGVVCEEKEMNDQLAIASTTHLAVDEGNKYEDGVSLSTTAFSSVEEDVVPGLKWGDTYFSNEDDIIAGLSSRR